MNIEQMTALGAVSRADVSKSRKVIDGDDGATIRLQHFQQGDVLCSALFLVPAEGDAIEFICAGRAGNWMREAANAFVEARQVMVEDGEFRTAETTCSEDIFQSAVDAGFNLIATPLGMMDLVREEESHSLSITCEAWGGEGKGCPAEGDAAWTVARVETLDRAEVGSLYILEEMAFDRALEVAAVLQGFTVREQNFDFTFETVAEMCQALEITEAGESLRIEDEPVEDVDPITPEDHIAAGEDLLAALDFDFDLDFAPEAPNVEMEQEPEVEYDMRGQGAFRF